MLLFVAYFTKLGLACGVNKKGHTLANFGQFVDEPPVDSLQMWSFWSGKDHCPAKSKGALSAVASSIIWGINLFKIHILLIKNNPANYIVIV